MGKRGRPTIGARYDMEDVVGAISRGSHKTQRTNAAHFYCSSVFGLLSEAASNIPHLEEIFYVRRDDDGYVICKQRTEIIEQLGRFSLQDGASDDEVLELAAAAATAYHNGKTVKEIKAAMLRVRARLRGGDLFLHE